MSEQALALPTGAQRTRFACVHVGACLGSLTLACVPATSSQALGKAPTFGIRDNRSIKDQRESLPIFKLREQLIQAVHDNQVCSSGRPAEVPHLWPRKPRTARLVFAAGAPGFSQKFFALGFSRCRPCPALACCAC